MHRSLPGLWRITKYFWPHLRQYRGLIMLSFAALLCEVLLRLLEPWPLKLVFDYVIGQRNAPRKHLSEFLAGVDPLVLLSLGALGVVVITCTRALASYWETIGFARLGNRSLAKVRTQLYRHIQYLSLSFHTGAKTGDLVVRLIGDVGMLQDVAVTALLPLLAKSLVVAGMLVLMFCMNWQLGVVAVAVFPLFWLRTHTLGEKIREVAQKQRRQEGALAASVAESMQAIRTVQALSLEEKFSTAFDSTSDNTSLSDVKGKRLSAALERSVDVLVALATALVLWFGTRMCLTHELSPGDLLVFLAYLKSAYRPVQDFAKYTARLGKASAAGERVIDLLERVPDVRDLPGAVVAPPLSGHIKFEAVSFAYHSHQPCLQNIHFEVKPGQHVALVGPSGGGKTTLFSLLLRLYDPVNGRVLIDGQDIRAFTLESLRTQFSVVLQDNTLFATTIRDNIAYGAASPSFEEIVSAALVANAHEFILRLPKGYETIVGERGVTLSHGQRQRIAIARAAIRQAPILILDEPMTGLDRSSERAVLEALERLYGKRTTLLITHNPRHAAKADLILYLEQGRIVEIGTHTQLLETNGRYAALHRIRVAERTINQVTSPFVAPETISA
ncbi:MAG TPA: ABC transporter ATP-binding protein [Candidatus Limnocylindrales bacterium]|nr:ABC transporter ATP-binding protein [Candidatus Limnocylindrales bacterium]